MQMLNNWINIIQDSCLPPTCILCNSSGFNRWDLCYDCYRQLPWAQHQCPQCGKSLSSEYPTLTPCGSCINALPAFDSTIAVFKHRDAIRFLIAGLKFNAQYKHARLLGLLLAEAINLNPIRPEAIIPMPLHPSRYKERGFNQSIEIAKTVAKQLKIPLLLNHCIRNRGTEHQTHLSKTERRKNVSNCFTQLQPLPFEHVAIIDDVMTTGSTAHELAKTLKAAGTQRVDMWVCAHA